MPWCKLSPVWWDITYNTFSCFTITSCVSGLVKTGQFLHIHTPVSWGLYIPSLPVKKWFWPIVFLADLLQVGQGLFVGCCRTFICLLFIYLFINSFFMHRIGLAGETAHGCWCWPLMPGSTWQVMGNLLASWNPTKRLVSWINTTCIARAIPGYD